MPVPPLAPAWQCGVSGVTNPGFVCVSSTGRASNLTSPSADFSPALPDTKQLPPSSSASKMTPSTSSPASKQLSSSSSLGKELAKDPAKEGDEVDCSVSAPEKIKHSSSSIIGLRAATFDQGQAAAATSKSRTDLSHLQAEAAAETEAKPRPPPKPRPWSIVGVDRKSGEFTSVETSAGAQAEDAEAAKDTGKDAAKDTAKEPEQGGGVAQRGSVRDMIANLNKPEGGGGGTVGGLLGGGSVRDRIASMNKDPAKDSAKDAAKKKGNSLPRTAVAEAINPGAKSPAKSSPHSFRRTESPKDDPRIMKLEDDFMYEDPVNV